MFMYTFHCRASSMRAGASASTSPRKLENTSSYSTLDPLTLTTDLNNTGKSDSRKNTREVNRESMEAIRKDSAPDSSVRKFIVVESQSSPRDAETEAQQQKLLPSHNPLQDNKPSLAKDKSLSSSEHQAEIHYQKISENEVYFSDTTPEPAQIAKNDVAMSDPDLTTCNDVVS